MNSPNRTGIKTTAHTAIILSNIKTAKKTLSFYALNSQSSRIERGRTFAHSVMIKEREQTIISSLMKKMLVRVQKTALC